MNPRRESPLTRRGRHLRRLASGWLLLLGLLCSSASVWGQTYRDFFFWTEADLGGGLIVSGQGGSISPSGQQSLRVGSSVTASASPSRGYVIGSWSVGGASQSGGSTFTFTVEPSGGNVVRVRFVGQRSYGVSMSAGSGGSIQSSLPNDQIYPGESVTFTASLSADYVVDAWTLNGATVQTGGNTFTVSNFSASMGYISVAVTFRRLVSSYTVTASAGPNGSVNPSGGVSVPAGGSQAFTATPDTGYTVDVWRVDGTVVQSGGTAFTLTDVRGNRAVQVTFKLVPVNYTINARAGTGGSISPGGTFQLQAGSSQTFTASPNGGYEVDRWEVDLIRVQTGGTSYTLSNVGGNRTVEVIFRLIPVPPHTITTSAGPNGSVNPSGAVSVNHGTSQVFTASPTSGYQVDEWRLDGTTVQVGGTAYTLGNVTTDHALSVSFRSGTYRDFYFWTEADLGGGLIVSDQGGSISPSGQQSLLVGSSVTASASPSRGYLIGGWTGGSVSQTGGSSFTFTVQPSGGNVVRVRFVGQRSYGVSMSAGSGGSVESSLPNDQVYPGESVVFTASPWEGYIVDAWTLNGAPAQAGGDTFTVANFSASMGYVSVVVTFRRPGGNFTITASAGPNGSIHPSGATSVPDGGSQTFTATPGAGHTVDTWRVDGTLVQTGGVEYTLSDVRANHAVEVTFRPSPVSYSVNAQAGAGGSINPGGTLQLAAGSSQTFTATPNEGYVVDHWEVDLIPVQTGGANYTLSDLDGNRTVEVLFRLGTAATHTVIASAGANGSISPSGAVRVVHGNTQVFTATPNPGHDVDLWRLDGTVVRTSGVSFTLDNVTSDHTLSVSFTGDTYRDFYFWTEADLGGGLVVSDQGGSISPAGQQSLLVGASVTASATPSRGYLIGSWSVAGATQTGGSTFTFVVASDGGNVVRVRFVGQRSYGVSMSAGSGGSIESSLPGDQIYPGESVTFTATPAIGYVVDGWTLNGAAAQSGGTTFTVSDFSAAMGSLAVAVAFRRPAGDHTLTASAGSGGRLDPSGTMSVADGGSQAFTASPNPGYAVDGWRVDGATVQGGGTNYTLTDVRTNHLVEVRFRLLPGIYTVNARASLGGAISPGGTLQLPAGSSTTFTATPSEGYVVDGWEVDLIPVQTGGASYTLSDLNGNHTVEVIFREGAATSHIVTASAGPGGSLSPNGAVVVVHGLSQSFAATPDSGREVDQWRLDGTIVQLGGTSFTLTKVISDHTLSVSFGGDVYRDFHFWTEADLGGGLIVGDQGGSISPAGQQSLLVGSSLTASAIPSRGYSIGGWSVANATQTGGDTFTFVVPPDGGNVVRVRFVGQRSYWVSMSAGVGGSVQSSLPDDQIYPGESVTFTATPLAGYSVDAWTLNGTSVQSGGNTLTVSGFSADLGQVSVVVTFRRPTGSYTIIASAGPEGSINPGGAVPIPDGGSQTFSAVPQPGHAVEEWRLDGTVVQAGGASYTLDDVRASHTLEVSFMPQPATFVVNAQAGLGGRINPGGTLQFPAGSTPAFTATPNEGYVVDTWEVDLIPVQTSGNHYTLPPLGGNHTVEVLFRTPTIASHTVSASAGIGGSMSPNGAVAVVDGQSQLFTATPEGDRQIHEWRLDGLVVQLGGTTFTLTNVTCDHTLSVSFEGGHYRDFHFWTEADLGGGTVVSDQGGSISPSGPQSLLVGSSVTASASPSRGYVIGGWSVAGVSQAGGNTFTFAVAPEGGNVVRVRFVAQRSYPVSMSAGTGGSLRSSLPNDQIYPGESATFTAVPLPGYAVEAWTLNESVVQSGGTTLTVADFSAAMGSIAVGVSFVPAMTDPVVVASAGSGGSLTPSGCVPVVAGGSLTFTATANAGYTVDQWRVDGATAQAGGVTFTLAEVRTNHAVEVQFRLLPGDCALQAEAGPGGNITPGGTLQLPAGSSQTFTALPEEGYTVDRWEVDLIQVQTGGTRYTLSNLSGHHTVAVRFRLASETAHTVAASAGAGGSVSPSGAVSVAHGNNQVFSATSEGGHLVGEWRLDGVTVQTGGADHILTNVTGDHVLSVSFDSAIYRDFQFWTEADLGNGTIVGDQGGTISPSGQHSLLVGSAVTASAFPGRGYRVGGWSVADLTQTGGSTFAFTVAPEGGNVVRVRFVGEPSYWVSMSAGSGGSIQSSLPNDQIYAGENVTFTANPLVGYVVDGWTLNGSDVQFGGEAFTVMNFSPDLGPLWVTVSFRLAASQYTVTASAGVGGGISPGGIVSVADGGSQTFTALPDDAHRVAVWRVDGAAVQIGGTSYTLVDVRASHAVEVVFGLLPSSDHVVMAEAGDGGHLDPSGQVLVPHGAAPTFLATPNDGFVVAGWTVDGTNYLSNAKSFTLPEVLSDRVLEVSFRPAGSFRPARSFRTTPALAVGAWPGSVAPADFNKDGGVDLAVSCTGENRTVILTNNGFGGFATQGSIPLGVGEVVAADVNDDAHPDLITIGAAAQSIAVLTNDGAGGWVLTSTLSTHDRPTRVEAVPNLFSSGKVGLVVTLYNWRTSTLELWSGGGNGHFSFQGYLSGGSRPPADIAWSDFNGDGRPDLASVNRADVEDKGTLEVWMNTGGGSFSRTSLPLQSHGWAVAAADANGDGKPDVLAVCANNSTVEFFANSGDAAFTRRQTIGVGGYPVGIVTLPGRKGPGWTDFATVDSSGNSVTVVTNDGSGFFGVSTNIPIGSAPSGLAAADVNGDGILDLVAANSKDGTLSILQGQSGLTPEVETLAATDVGSQTAILNAWVAPNGSPTLAWFEWSIDAGPTNQTAAVAFGPEIGSAPVSLQISDLVPGLTCQFRVCASNSFGLSSGSLASVVLLPPTPSAIQQVQVTANGVVLEGLSDPRVPIRVWVTPSLSPPVEWQNVSTSTAHADGHWQVLVPAPDQPPQLFYRISTP